MGREHRVIAEKKAPFCWVAELPAAVLWSVTQRQHAQRRRFVFIVFLWLISL